MGSALAIREARSEAGLTQAELARLAGTSQAMVARYESDAASPTIRTLERILRSAGRELVISTTPATTADLSTPAWQTLRLHRSEIRALARAMGARNVRVFGSVARGNDRPDSDIDLMVDFPVRQSGLLPLILLTERLEQLLGRPVDLAAAEAMRPEVLQTALAEAIPL